VPLNSEFCGSEFASRIVTDESADPATARTMIAADFGIVAHSSPFSLSTVVRVPTSSSFSVEVVFSQDDETLLVTRCVLALRRPGLLWLWCRSRIKAKKPKPKLNLNLKAIARMMPR
jgi:hypothetical protein